MKHRRLTLDARWEICSALCVDRPCPDEMIGSLAAVPLPGRDLRSRLPAGGLDPLQEHLFQDCSIEVPVTLWSEPPRRAIRISAHLHNTFEQYRYLAAALTENLPSLS